jgi:hypothetical protein
MLGRVVQPVKSRLLSVSELSLSVFSPVAAAAGQATATVQVLCCSAGGKKGKGGGRKKKMGYIPP